MVVSLIRNNGNAGESSENWCLGSSIGGAFKRVLGYHPRKKSLKLYMQNHTTECIFGRQMVSNAVCIFKHVSNLNGVLTRSPLK